MGSRRRRGDGVDSGCKAKERLIFEMSRVRRWHCTSNLHRHKWQVMHDVTFPGHRRVSSLV
jgi:hypothetical protein